MIEEERKKCKSVADAFRDQLGDIEVLESYRHGFIKLGNYEDGSYGEADCFYDSEVLFDDLWNEWLSIKLYDLAKGTPLIELDYGEIFQCLSEAEQKKLMQYKKDFRLRCFGN